MQKYIKAFLDALGMDYEMHMNNNAKRQNSPSPMEEEELFNRLKNALSEIKKWENGEVELNDARAFITNQ